MLSFKKIANFLKRVGNNDNSDGKHASPRGGTEDASTVHPSSHIYGLNLDAASTNNGAAGSGASNAAGYGNNHVSSSNVGTGLPSNTFANAAVLHGLSSSASTEEVLIHIRTVLGQRKNHWSVTETTGAVVAIGSNSSNHQTAGSSDGSAVFSKNNNNANNITYLNAALPESRRTSPFLQLNNSAFERAESAVGNNNNANKADESLLFSKDVSLAPSPSVSAAANTNAVTGPETPLENSLRHNEDISTGNPARSYSPCYQTNVNIAGAANMGGMCNVDLLSTLQVERGELIDALDICLQEIPTCDTAVTNFLPAAASASGAGPFKLTDTNTNDVQARSNLNKLGGNPGNTVSGLASTQKPSVVDDKEIIVPAAVYVPLVTPLSHGNDESVSFIADAEKSESNNAISATTDSLPPRFDIFEWRLLLQNIFNALVNTERAIYIERNKKAANTRHDLEVALEEVHRAEAALEPSTDTATSRSGANSELASMVDTKNSDATDEELSKESPVVSAAQVQRLKEKVKSKEKEFQRDLEETLGAAISTATWTMLRNIITQHIRHAEKKRERLFSTSQLHPSVSNTAPSPPLDIERKDDTNRDSSPEVDPKALEALRTGNPQGPLCSSPPPIATNDAVFMDEVVKIEWRVVVSEVKELLGFVEENIAQCILCAALLRDDGRELTLCILQSPKPRSVLTAALANQLRNANAEKAGAPTQVPNLASGTSSASLAASPRGPITRAGSISGSSTQGNTSSWPSSSSSANVSQKISAASPTSVSASTAVNTTNVANTTMTSTANAKGTTGISQEMVVDDLLEHLEYVYKLSVSKTFQRYLEESLLELEKIGFEDDESNGNLCATNNGVNTSSANYNTLNSFQEDDDANSSSTAKSSLCSPARASRQDCAANTTSANPPSASTNTVLSPSVQPIPAPSAMNKEKENSKEQSEVNEEEVKLPTVVSRLNDPRIFCQLATAFFFCSDSWTEKSRFAVFRSLNDGIGAHMVKENNLRSADPSNRQRQPTLYPGSSGSRGETPYNMTGKNTTVSSVPPAQTAQVSATTTVTNVTSQPLRTSTWSVSGNNTPVSAPSASLIWDTNSISMNNQKCDVMNSTSNNVNLEGTTSHNEHNNLLNSTMVAAMYREAFKQQLQDKDDDEEEDYTEAILALPVVMREILERIVNISWSAALHKHVQHCLSSRPPLLDEATYNAKQERKAALMYNDFRAKQRALASIVSTQLTSGKSQEAFVVAKKHFNLEKKEWTSKGQTMFSAIQYLQSMKMLVRTQAASRNYGAVIETVQFVLPQAKLCEQMLEVLCPRPRGSFILRFGECRAKLLQARIYLSKECWRAYFAIKGDDSKIEKYFKEHLFYLHQLRRRDREAGLFETYMDRGSQLMYRNEYSKCVEQFRKAAELSKAALATADGKANNAVRVAGSTVSPFSATTASPSIANVASPSGASISSLYNKASAENPGARDSMYNYKHLRVAGSGSLATAEEHINNASPHTDEVLELYWRVAESLRMLALAHVIQAEHEVNVRERRGQLSNAVNNAYASQTALHKWQSKGGTPKRMLIAVPCSLFVTCKALSLLKQSRKAALQLEPLIEDKPNSATIRPPMWKELLDPTEDPLTAEDVVLRVNVSCVKLSVYLLYVKCLSNIDGEKALRAAQLVKELLEQTEEWIHTVAIDVREQHALRNKALVLDKENKEALQQQQDATKTVANINSNNPNADVESGSGFVTPSQPQWVTGGNSDHQSAVEVNSLNGNEININVSRTTDNMEVTPLSGTKTSTLPPGGLESDQPNQNQFSGGNVGSMDGSGNPIAVQKEAVSHLATADVEDFSQGPALIPVEPAVHVVIESRSERLTALHALRLGRKEVQKAYRDLEIILGDTYFFIQKTDEALKSYSSALLISEEACSQQSQRQRELQRRKSTREKAVAADSAPIRSVSSAPSLGIEENQDIFYFSDDENEDILSTTVQDIRMMIVHDDNMDAKTNENLILSRLADVYKMLQKPSMAIHYNKLVIEYAHESKDELLEYKSMLQLARLYTQWNMCPQEAQDLWEKVSALAKQYEDAEVGRETMRNIVSGQEAAGMYVDVVHTAQELCNLANEADDSSDASADRRYALEALARAQLQLAQYEKCLESLDLREKEQERTGEWSGQMMEMRAKALLGTGKAPEALRVLNSWVNKAKNLRLLVELGLAHKALATAHAANDDIFDARRNHECALEAFSQVLILRNFCKTALLDSARWLVHYYYLNEDKVLVDKNVKQILPQKAQVNNSLTDSSLSSFDHNLHNNSGDLGKILEEDEKMRAALSQPSDFGESFLDGEDDFLDFKGSFHGGDMESLLNNDTPFETINEENESALTTSDAEEKESKSNTSSDNDTNKQTDPKLDDGETKVSDVLDLKGDVENKSGSEEQSQVSFVDGRVIEFRPPPSLSDTMKPKEEADNDEKKDATETKENEKEQAPPPKTNLFLDLSKTAGVSEKEAVASLLSASNKEKATPPAEKPAAQKGNPVPMVKGIQPPSSTIANVSVCNRPAAAVGGTDILDTHDDAEHSDSHSDSEANEAIDIFNDRPPSKVSTLCFRSALINIEWSHQLIQAHNTLSLYSTIPYSPADAVDLALLTYRDCTFVFYFAEYTTTSSSCYDVVVRPAGYDHLCIHRSAQVTSLHQYHKVKFSDFTNVAPADDHNAKSRAELARAVFGDGSPETAVKLKGKDKKENTSNVNSPIPKPTEDPVKLLQKKTLTQLYDIYDELWSPIKSAFRKAKLDIADCTALILVPDCTLLHTPFAALLPNPDMSMPGDNTDPLGAVVPMVVCPSLTHLAMHGSAADRSESEVQLDSKGHVVEQRNIMFLPESASSPLLPLATDPAGNSAEGANDRFSECLSTLGNTTLMMPPLRPGSVTGFISLQSAAATLNKALVKSNSSDQIDSPQITDEAARFAASPISSPLASADPFNTLRSFWKIHHDCTRKELMNNLTNPAVKGFMLLCTPLPSGNKVADGKVTVYDFINIGNMNYASSSNNPTNTGSPTVDGPSSGQGDSNSGGGGGAGGDAGSRTNGKKTSKAKECNLEYELASFVPQRRNNIELMVLASDRSEQTSVDALGVAATLCAQLHVKRILRLDLVPGEPLNAYHKQFIITFLDQLERCRQLSMELSYAKALYNTIAEFYRTYGDSHTEWSAFTLVGIP